MRILVISNLFPYQTNRAFGIFTARQFEMAAKLGADITVIFPIVWIPKIFQNINSKWKNYNENHLPVVVEGLRVITVPYLRFTRGLKSYRWDGLSIFRATRKKILSLHQRKPFDIIYGKGIFPSADVGVRLAKILKIPVVGEGIGGDVLVAPDVSPTMYKHFLRVIQAINGAVADGKGVAERLSAAMKMDIPTIHGLVNLNEFSPLQNKTALRRELNLPPDAQILLFVGYLKKEKGINELVEAFDHALENLPNMCLIVCGSGPEHANLSAMIENRNLNGRVQILGSIEPNEIHKWMKASDVFILPSYTEGMPNVVMEAMACGLPVISTTVGGMPDAIGNCEGAILVEPNNVEQLASAIQKVCGNTEQYKKMSLIARRTAEEKFSLEKNVKKTLNYLDKIIAQSK